MNCRMVVGDKRVKRVEISDCAKEYGFRIVATGIIPEEKTNDLSVLLEELLDKDTIPIGNEIVEFKKKFKKEGLLVFEKRYYNIEYLTQLNSELGTGEIFSMTIKMHICRSPKWWFIKH